MKFETDVKTSSYNLTIPKLGTSHHGSYSVKAINQVGEAEVSFTINVLGKIKINQNMYDKK